jgi:hypothetical protein
MTSKRHTQVDALGCSVTGGYANMIRDALSRQFDIAVATKAARRNWNRSESSPSGGANA